MIIDLRSDTITKPTPDMLEQMMAARVGDDVFREDHEVNDLEHFAASYFGFEQALFCTSGTMANQIAIMVHTKPGDEVICSDLAHIYLYEGGGIAANAGCSVRLLSGDRGRISAAQVAANINAVDIHLPSSTLVCVENTVNKGGGSIYDTHELEQIKKLCRERGLKFHCDGARILNALVAQAANPAEMGSLYDSLSVCLSKGLGAPVGSLLLGSRSFIDAARRVRKRLGGGMRQAGYLAAAGRFALQHHVQRLADDHRRAQKLVNLLKAQSWVSDIMPVETNIVIFQLKTPLQAPVVVAGLGELGIRCFAFGNDKIRWVTHLDFLDEHLDKLSGLLSDFNPYALDVSIAGQSY